MPIHVFKARDVVFFFHSWLYTLAEAPHIYQKVQDGIEQEDTPSTDCKFTARSTLSLQMTSQLDRATFICTTSSDTGEDGKPQKYDEVLIVLYGKDICIMSYFFGETFRRIFANLRETVHDSAPY